MQLSLSFITQDSRGLCKVGDNMGIFHFISSHFTSLGWKSEPHGWSNFCLLEEKMVDSSHFVGDRTLNLMDG
jgi:hypothetical protein